MAALTAMPPQVSTASLQDARGSSFKLADFSGKVMLVNLWASWGGPCRREISELVKLHKEFHSRGVEIIGLSTENPNASAEKVQKFIQDFRRRIAKIRSFFIAANATNELSLWMIFGLRNICVNTKMRTVALCGPAADKLLDVAGGAPLSLTIKYYYSSFR
jgi:thiol-disulfide isomerase/thioredoxin